MFSCSQLLAVFLPLNVTGDCKMKHSAAAYCLVGLVVKASTLRAADLGFASRMYLGDFSMLSHTSDLKIGTPVATVPGAWRSRLSAGTGCPGVSIL